MRQGACKKLSAAEQKARASAMLPLPCTACTARCARHALCASCNVRWISLLTRQNTMGCLLAPPGVPRSRIRLLPGVSLQAASQRARELPDAERSPEIKAYIAAHDSLEQAERLLLSPASGGRPSEREVVQGFYHLVRGLSKFPGFVQATPALADAALSHGVPAVYVRAPRGEELFCANMSPAFIKPGPAILKMLAGMFLLPQLSGQPSSATPLVLAEQFYRHSSMEAESCFARTAEALRRDWGVEGATEHVLLQAHAIASAALLVGPAPQQQQPQPATAAAGAAQPEGHGEEGDSMMRDMAVGAAEALTAGRRVRSPLLFHLLAAAKQGAGDGAGERAAVERGLVLALKEKCDFAAALLSFRLAACHMRGQPSPPWRMGPVQQLLQQGAECWERCSSWANDAMADAVAAARAPAEECIAKAVAAGATAESEVAALPAKCLAADGAAARARLRLGPCAACGRFSPTLKRCSRCRAVKYCSVSCQREAWRQGHRRECAALAAADEQ
ncbi:hypothetical protein ABPG75_003530 [Micractinium tetrahymenae]